MRQKILKLKSKNWKNFAVQISDILKKEIYGKYGGEVINSIREEYENDRRKKIDRLRKNFIKTATISNMDSKVNLLTKKIYKINNEVQTVIAYDFLNYVDKNKSKLSDVCPNCIQVSKYVLKSKRPNLLINYRLISIVNLLISNSISQSGKSNAGNVGEFFVSAILDSIGMKEGKEYKRQHISKSGSDTDIVLPYVEDMKDNELMVCCAIQFTSNDRLRMVSGELKSGRKFTITGNGMDAAPINCDKIGLQILKNAMEQNHNLVCYDMERKRIIKKLQKQSKQKLKSGGLTKNAKEAEGKLDYYKNYTLSFSEFAKEIKKIFR